MRLEHLCPVAEHHTGHGRNTDQEEHSQAGADSSRHECQSKPQSLKAAVDLDSHRVGSSRQHSDL